MKNLLTIFFLCLASLSWGQGIPVNFSALKIGTPSQPVVSDDDTGTYAVTNLSPQGGSKHVFTTTINARVKRVSDNQWLNSSGAWQSTTAIAQTATDSSSPFTGAGVIGVANFSGLADAGYFDDLTATAN